MSRKQSRNSLRLSGFISLFSRPLVLKANKLSMERSTSKKSEYRRASATLKRPRKMSRRRRAIRQKPRLCRASPGAADGGRYSAEALLRRHRRRRHRHSRRRLPPRPATRQISSSCPSRAAGGCCRCATRCAVARQSRAALCPASAPCCGSPSSACRRKARSRLPLCDQSINQSLELSEHVLLA